MIRPAVCRAVPSRISQNKIPPVNIAVHRLEILADHHGISQPEKMPVDSTVTRPQIVLIDRATSAQHKPNVLCQTGRRKIRIVNHPVFRMENVVAHTARIRDLSGTTLCRIFCQGKRAVVHDAVVVRAERTVVHYPALSRMKRPIINRPVIFHYE